jgi:hypothetical protein
MQKDGLIDVTHVVNIDHLKTVPRFSSHIEQQQRPGSHAGSEPAHRRQQILTEKTLTVFGSERQASARRRRSGRAKNWARIADCVIRCFHKIALSQLDEWAGSGDGRHVVEAALVYVRIATAYGGNQ